MTSKERADAARKWAESKEGAKALNELADKCKEMERQMTNDNRISLESLRKPVTI